MKPEHLSWHEAAALPLAGLTAWRALMRQGAATRESRVLITGIGGGVALATLGFAHALGCRIAVTTSHATKQQRALELGAELALDRADSSWPQQLEIYWNGGADIVIDGAGGEGLNLLLDALKPGGTLVVYGATAGVPQQLDLRKVFWRQQRIQGSTMGSPTDWVQMMAAVNRDRIRPSIDSVRPLKHAAEALTRMQAGQQFGKLVINCD